MAPFTRNQRLTIALGVVGFFLSLFNSYFQFFYSTYELKVAVADINCDTDTLDFSLVMINSGTTDCVILSAYPYATFNNGVASSIGSHHMSPNINMVLKPGEMKPFGIRVPFPSREYYPRAFPPDSTFILMSEARKIPISLYFHTFDARGTEYRTQSDIVNIHLNNKGTVFFDMGPMILNLHH